VTLSRKLYDVIVLTSLRPVIAAAAVITDSQPAASAFGAIIHIAALADRVLYTLTRFPTDATRPHGRVVAVLKHALTTGDKHGAQADGITGREF
jgi:hypothetical protein